jgi:cellulose biosynthesis protein BcsQ
MTNLLDSSGESLPLPRIIAVASGKGGTGKSTSALALAHVLAHDHSIRVALLDLDPQASVTEFAGLRPVDNPAQAPPIEAHGITMFPGGRALMHATEAEIGANIDRALSLARVAIVDLSPASGDVGHRAVFARQDVLLLLAVRLDLAGLRAVRELTAMADQRKIPYRVAPMFGKRWSVAIGSAGALPALRGFYGEVVTDTTIPEDVKAAEAAGVRLPVTRYAPKSRAAVGYRALAAELLALGVQP